MLQSQSYYINYSESLISVQRITDISLLRASMYNDSVERYLESSTASFTEEKIIYYHHSLNHGGSLNQSFNEVLITRTFLTISIRKIYVQVRLLFRLLHWNSVYYVLKILKDLQGRGRKKLCGSLKEGEAPPFHGDLKYGVIICFNSCIFLRRFLGHTSPSRPCFPTAN